MSASICKFEAREKEEDTSLHLQAFAGGKEGPSIQFTIGEKYACLSLAQLQTLLGIIRLRIDGGINGGYEDYNFLIQRNGAIRNNGKGDA